MDALRPVLLAVLSKVPRLVCTPTVIIHVARAQLLHGQLLQVSIWK